jgi:hypothetical protein
MPITLKGIRLESLDIQRSKDTGQMMMNSSVYSLISSADKVLANQTVGGYGGMTVSASPETLSLLEKFMASYKRDITTVLGLEEA